MPTDDDVDGLFAAVSKESGREDGVPSEYGTGRVIGQKVCPFDRRFSR